MKISIENFKSIGSLVDYEILPLNILSGTNSSGKSSFIQVLLLLKQTIEIDSAEYPLFFNGKLFEIKNYLDVVKDKNNSNRLKVGITFSKREIESYKHFPEIGIYEVFEDYNLIISFEFDSKENRVFVSRFEVKFVFHNTDRKEQYINFNNNLINYSIDTNTGVFNDNLFYEKGKYQIKKINYSSFIPSDYGIEFFDGSISKEVPKLDGIKAILKDFFASLNYIGPLRERPKDEYRYTDNNNTVGRDGEFVAEVLERYSNNPTKYFALEEENDLLKFTEREGTFLDAVRYWLCENFKLCSDIYSKKEADSYVIYVKSLSGIESTVKHVGFGISQILPIIVEGLKISYGETLILEQPEIHLHPKIQSRLFDFLISIMQQGKKVIIETHSDHLITRLRRRIAEDEDNALKDNIVLTFVESSYNDLLFRNIGIDDMGGLDYFPEDFIEKADVEMKAILKAQMKKRLTKRYE